VVCDGFVGNVMLKASEGMVQMVRSFIRQEFMRSVLARLAGVIVMPVLYAFRKRLDPRRFNGATLLGLKGIVVKSHGSADVFGFERAIERAMEEVRNEVLHRLMLRFGQSGNSEAVET
jgi:glycerol-3-phosphate acyltransferase PlsX